MYTDFSLIKFLSLKKSVVFYLIVLLKTVAFAILMLFAFRSFSDTIVRFLVFFGTSLVFYFSMLNLKDRILKEFN
jgi:positive regulator of sigma E activity